MQQRIQTIAPALTTEQWLFVCFFYSFNYAHYGKHCAFCTVISIWIYHLLLQCVVDIIKELCKIQRKMFTCVWHELKVYVILQCRWWDNSNPLCYLKQNKGLMPKNENGGNLKEMPMNERKKWDVQSWSLLNLQCYLWLHVGCGILESAFCLARMEFTWEWFSL